MPAIASGVPAAVPNRSPAAPANTGTNVISDVTTAKARHVQHGAERSRFLADVADVVGRRDGAADHERQHERAHDEAESPEAHEGPEALGSHSLSVREWS